MKIGDKVYATNVMCGKAVKGTLVSDNREYWCVLLEEDLSPYKKGETIVEYKVLNHVFPRLEEGLEKLGGETPVSLENELVESEALLEPDRIFVYVIGAIILVGVLLLCFL